jgi:poly-gamma-glutamate synthesis protein (capsule biosynthesis protein)
MKILIAGDFCPRDRVATLIEEENHSEVFGEVKPYTQDVDLAIVNLEAPIVKSPTAKPIEKCGPNLRCTSKAIEALKYAGFNMVTLANNHLYDFGEEGLKDTLGACGKSNIATVGAGMNLAEAAKTSYQNINGQTLAIVNCCEHEFSIATETTGGCNPLNPIQQFYAIQEAKQKADYVIVIVHGGHEHYQLPSPRMKETYRFFIDAGADAVINHHQHCYSGYEVYKEKPIFYGLGNFCFDRNTQRNSFWNEGYMVKLSLDKNECLFDLIPYVQGNDSAGVCVLADKSSFEKSINDLNSIIADNKQLKEKHQKWMTRTSKGYVTALEPYSNRISLGLYARGFLPSFMTKHKKYRLLNILECEAHLERTIHALKRI